MGVLDQVRDYWDADAATYDRSATHAVKTAGERAAWNAALRRYLPAAPARILDVGAGTGFLSLALARLGYEVTALDLSSEMLARLAEAAQAEDLDVTIVEGPANRPPSGSFDAVVERHLIWLLPDPEAALRVWRDAVVDGGRLLLVEGLWGEADRAEARRQELRGLMRRLRRVPAGHHASFELGDRLPFGSGARPDQFVELVERAGWRTPLLERLRDVEWARLLAMPPHDRLLGTTPQYVIAADR